MSTNDLLLASLGFNIAIVAAAAVFAMRIRERLARLEEWARLTEKRINGKGDS